MTMPVRRYFLSVIKYFALFIIIYTAVNLWRSPTLPDSPALSYTDRSGQVIDVIQKSHDTPILVYFWGTWCGVCRTTSPAVQALHADGTDVLTVAVSSGTDGELSAYMTRHGYTFTTINDTHGKTFSAWGGQVTPSFVILHDGKIAQGFTGIAPLWLLKARLWWANF